MQSLVPFPDQDGDAIPEIVVKEVADAIWKKGETFSPVKNGVYYRRLVVLSDRVQCMLRHGYPRTRWLPSAMVATD